MSFRIVPNAWADEDEAEDAARAADGPPGPPVPGVRWRLAHLPPLLTASGLLLLAAVLTGALAQNAVGAAGAALGVGIVVFSYLLSTAFLAVVDSVQPALILPMGMALYTTKFALFGVVMWGLSRSGWPGLPALAIALCAAIVVWTGVHIWWLSTRGRPRP